MAGDYQSFQSRKSQLIRKAKEGSSLSPRWILLF